MSHLADTVMECLRLCDQMKANGEPPEARQQMIENALRQCWPFTREWHTLCPICDDYGLEMRTCGGGMNSPCGFRKEHRAHEYGRPCSCKAGIKFEKRERSQDDLVDAAARTSKPKKTWTQAGR